MSAWLFTLMSLTLCFSMPLAAADPVGVLEGAASTAIVDDEQWPLKQDEEEDWGDFMLRVARAAEKRVSTLVPAFKKYQTACVSAEASGKLGKQIQLKQYEVGGSVWEPGASYWPVVLYNYYDKQEIFYWDEGKADVDLRCRHAASLATRLDDQSYDLPHGTVMHHVELYAEGLKQMYVLCECLRAAGLTSMRYVAQHPQFANEDYAWYCHLAWDFLLGDAAQQHKLVVTESIEAIEQFEAKERQTGRAGSLMGFITSYSSVSRTGHVGAEEVKAAVSNLTNGIYLHHNAIATCLFNGEEIHEDTYSARSDS